MGCTVTNAKIKNGQVVTYTRFLDFDRNRKINESDEADLNCHNHGFGASAQKRLSDSMDNFANIFEAVNTINQYTTIDLPTSFFDIKLKRKVKKNGVLTEYVDIVKRKPVFLTLTVPEQNQSDEYVKNNLLKPLLDNLKKSRNLKLYIWKAEAQLRGAIHFHVVIDCFVAYEDVKRLWYKYLVKNKCINSKKIPYTQASRIVHLKKLDRLDSIRFELAGYFAARCNDNGTVAYKHDHSKSVRSIEGNAWGRSDNLDYDALSFFDVDYDFGQLLKSNALKVIPIDTKAGDNVANVYLFTKFSRYKSGGKSHISASKNKIGSDVDLLLRLYHYEMAASIYGREYEEPGGGFLPKSLHHFLYDNPKYELCK